MPRRPPGARPATMADEPAERALEITCQEALYKNLLVSQAAALLVAIVFAVFFEARVEAPILNVWLGYMVLMGAFRIGSRQLFLRAAEPRDLRAWDRLFLIGAALAGAGWGTAGLLFFDPGNFQQQILLTGAIAGVSAGSLPHLSPSPRAAYTFLTLCLAPLAYAYLTHPALGPGLGVMIVLYLLTMLFAARRTHDSLRDNILLLHGNQRLVRQLTERTAALEAAKAQDEQERELALSVFQSLLPHGALAAGNIAYHLSSHSAFNGDLLLVENRPDGRQHLMLGDFTGHGLAASLGAIPTTDIFVTMTRKGFPLHVIAAEINRKLYDHLPANLFCAACLVEVDPTDGYARVWNGGIPSAYLLQQGGGIRETIDAMHPPLGILSPAAFDATVRTLRMDVGDQVFMATDGVIEQRNAGGEMFGEQRLEAILAEATGIAEVSRDLKAALARFGRDVGQGDDITFVALRAEPDEGLPALGPDGGNRHHSDALLAPDWSLKLGLDAAALRRIDPVPLLNHVVRELTGAGERVAAMELVLGELYRNALDHGVLGLDSSQKRSADGFEAYYEAREARLAQLADGKVTITLHNHPTMDGGMLEVHVSDTGAGFDHAAVLADKPVEDQAHGRGIGLVRGFCRELEYLGRGNRVRALLNWRGPN